MVFAEAVCISQLIIFQNNLLVWKSELNFQRDIKLEAKPVKSKVNCIIMDSSKCVLNIICTF